MDESLISWQYCRPWCVAMISLILLVGFSLLLSPVVPVVNDLINTCTFQNKYIYNRASNPDNTGTALIPLHVRDFLIFTLLRVLLAYLVFRIATKLYHAIADIHVKDRELTRLESSLPPAETPLILPSTRSSSSPSPPRSPVEPRPQPRILRLHPILFASIYAACTGIFLFFAFAISYTPFPWLKSLTGDSECSMPPRTPPEKDTLDLLRHTPSANGVSGHAFYCVFHALMAMYLLTLHQALVARKQRLIPNNSSTSSVHCCIRRGLASLTIWGVILVAIMLGWTLTVTYLYGYHSPRQMALGSVLGVPVGLGVAWILERTRLYLCF